MLGLPSGSSVARRATRASETKRRMTASFRFTRSSEGRELGSVVARLGGWASPGESDRMLPAVGSGVVAGELRSAYGAGGYALLRYLRFHVLGNLSCFLRHVISRQRPKGSR